MGKREYNYYAFISYSRADEKWAKWIQRKLETYRFPTALRKENPNLPAKIFPICRDKTDLPGGVLWEQLKNQLEESEYLIVICSPNSAGADWVNREITYFQSLGRNKNIIPFIVDGEPHADDSTKECYNEALRNKSEEELLGVSISELGRNKAILRVIASLMHLRYDQLVMRDRRRFRKRQAAVVGLLTVLIAVSVAIVWYEIPHNAYYWSYVYRNEAPVGLEEVSAKEQKTAHDYYKIVTRRNKVIRLERVNSVGTVTDGLTTFAIDGFPVVEFFYNEKGQLNSVTQKDALGNARLVKNYTQGLNAVDFQNPDDDTMFGTLPSNLASNMGISSLLGISSEKSEIARQLMEYDENGYLVQELYMWDNRNTPACDKNGIYGKKYTRDESGKILRVTNMGEDGEPLRMQHGTLIAFTDYEYDNYGRIIRCSVYDADGNPMLDERNVFCWENIYNDAGCVTQVRCLDTDGNPISNLEGISQYGIKCDENGFLMERYGMSKEGNAAYDKNSGACREVYKTDTYGRIVDCAYYDADDELMISNYGFASVSYKYDARGRTVEQWHYGLDGELTYASNGNYAGSTVEYQDNDNTIVCTYYNTDGEIALSQTGNAIYIQKSNAQGLLVEETYCDAEGSPIRARGNVASIAYGYDNAAHLTSISYFDENGMPCNNYMGVAAISRGYDKDGNQTSEQYYNAEGIPCDIRYQNGKYSKWENEYNSYGRITKVRYYGRNGELLRINDICETQMEYDEQGNCIRYTYYDHLGNLTNNSDGYAIVESTYNERGDLFFYCYLDKNGAFITNQNYAYKMEYDKRGNLLRSSSYVLDEEGKETCRTTICEYDERDNLLLQYFEDDGGQLCPDENGIAIYERTYDERNRVITTTYYDENRKLTNWREDNDCAIIEIYYDENNRRSSTIGYTIDEENDEQSPSLLIRTVHVYDVYGNQTEKWFYDSNGEVISDSDGIACTAKTYNVMGDSIYEVFCNDRGQAVAGSDGYAAREITYDAVGRAIQYNYYDENGEPMTQESGWRAYEYLILNDWGYIEEWILCNETGEYFRSEEFSPHVVYTYDQQGGANAVWYYNCDGQLIDANIKVAYIDAIEEDGPADLAGLQNFDIILQYGDWRFLSYDSDDNTDFSALEDIIYTLTDQRKTIWTCRINSDNEKDEVEKVEFQKCTLEAGLIGGMIQERWVDLKTVRLIWEQLKQRDKSD